MQSNKNKLTVHFLRSSYLPEGNVLIYSSDFAIKIFMWIRYIFIVCCWLFFKRGKQCRQRKREENTKPWHFFYLACKPIWFPLIYRSCFLLSLILTSGIWHLKTFLQSPILSKSQWSPLGVTFVFVLGCFMVVSFEAPSTE